MDKKELYLRLRQTFDFLRDKGVVHTQSEFAEMIGIRIGHLNNAMNGDEKRLTRGLMEKIADAFPDVLNRGWLLTGEGQMEKIDTQKLKLHIPADKAVVSAGFVGAAIGSVREDECELKQVIPYLPRYDYTIHVKGDSMFPTILNGDIVACERLDGGVDFKEDKIYILDTDSGAAIKRVRRLGNSLICHSDNPEYSDFTIQSIEHIRIARVVGVVREL